MNIIILIFVILLAGSIGVLFARFFAKLLTNRSEMNMQKKAVDSILSQNNTYYIRNQEIPLKKMVIDYLKDHPPLPQKKSLIFNLFKRKEQPIMPIPQQQINPLQDEKALQMEAFMRAFAKFQENKEKGGIKHGAKKRVNTHK